MTHMPSELGEHGKQHNGNSPEIIPEDTIIAYNMDNNKTPGELKVRWKIKVVTGPDADRVDARQAEAIRELLQWAHRKHATDR
jgi:hypothetical protein